LVVCCDDPGLSSPVPDIQANRRTKERVVKVVIIGGSGHVGTYLVPRLVVAGHEVVNVSRGQATPYQPHAAWTEVQTVTLDRVSAEADGDFGQRIRDLQPDVVIDMICFTLDSARQLVEAVRGQVQHLLHCGTIWVHGPSVEVPTTETQPRKPFGPYGIQKAEIEAYLLGEARRAGFPVTVLHPGHIVGPGWRPVNPAGHLTPRVFTQLAHGEELALPNLGLETLHHVHADDVAQAFMQALAHWSTAVGESFHVVSPAALTLRGYAEAMAAWFGQPARLRFMPWSKWRETATEDEARATWDHIAHSPNCSIARAQRLLDYAPRYRSLEAIQEAVRWLIGQGIVEVPESGAVRI
jgi:nucleoside-diphosphate-sugar epimerase